MDDDESLISQLELMHALQNRAPLRRVELEERPRWVGGLKCSPSPELGGLQAELMQSSKAMQLRLRPQLEKMAEAKAKIVHNDHWIAMRNDLREAIRRREEEYQHEPRMLYQIRGVLERTPGWLSLQEEIRHSRRETILQPVQSDGFYVVKVLPGRDGRFIVL